MKLKTSFFNGTVLKKNILRYSPLWGLYTVYLLFCVCVPISSQYEHINLAYEFSSIVVPVLPYAFICATMLFGDLFKTRMCNALHAMPLRRETWLMTHVLSGLLFALVPHTLSAIIMTCFLEDQVFIAWLWWLMVSGKFLFHFSLAVLCVMFTGNRLGHIAVFLLISYFTVLIEGIYFWIYEPLLYGVSFINTNLDMFSPALYLSEKDFFGWRYLSASSSGGYHAIYTYTGIIPKVWIHLGICTILSIPIIFAALYLYRQKKLEDAGNFINAKCFQWIFQFLGSTLAGALIPIAGFPIAFFGANMLIERSVKVFHKKNWLRFAIMAGAVLLTIGLTTLDPLNVVERIPDVSETNSVTFNGGNFTNSDAIEGVRTLHAYALENRDDFGAETYLNLSYHLKNGQTVNRTYYIDSSTPETMPIIRKLTSSLTYIFGTDDIAKITDGLASVYQETATGSTVYYTHIRPEDYDALFHAISLDAENGMFAQVGYIHTGYYLEPLCFVYEDGKIIEIELYTDCTNTVSYLTSYE